MRVRVRLRVRAGVRTRVGVRVNGLGWVTLCFALESWSGFMTVKGP